MESGTIIGLLAIVTLVLVAGAAIFHFTRHLREPRNRDAVTNVFKEDGSSATTAVRGSHAPEHLRQNG